MKRKRTFTNHTRDAYERMRRREFGESISCPGIPPESLEDRIADEAEDDDRGQDGEDPTFDAGDAERHGGALGAEHGNGSTGTKHKTRATVRGSPGE